MYAITADAHGCSLEAGSNRKDGRSARWFPRRCRAKDMPRLTLSGRTCRTDGRGERRARRCLHSHLSAARPKYPNNESLCGKSAFNALLPCAERRVRTALARNSLELDLRARCAGPLPGRGTMLHAVRAEFATVPRRSARDSESAPSSRESSLLGARSARPTTSARSPSPSDAKTSWVNPQDRGAANGLRAGKPISLIRSMRSASISCNSCSAPLGHRMRTVSRTWCSPSPK